ncbi:MAG: hypothetical protein K8T89_11670 [Planctomycetes bacterium]|nr:hypothetical protein [Planctomycetota bacterium]
MPQLFALTMFVSATLLFLVQPMIGKMVLPLLGGTPAVWNTCMVFYQALLLAGYYYAHRSTATLSVKKQTTLHAAVLLTALGSLIVAAALSTNNSPIPIVKSLSPQGDDYPFFGVILLLTVAIGLPFFVVSTSAPLLQKWFAETGHPSSKDPYFLYAASNFGSLLALVAYPAVVEPNLRLIHQVWMWAIGYGILVVLVFTCARVVNRSSVPSAKPTTVKGKPIPAPKQEMIEPEPTTLRKLRWLALAFVPSSLMLGVTTFVSLDMGSLPLLWIIPLSLYLITFIIVFSKLPSYIHLYMTLLMPVMVLLIAFLMTSHVKATFGLQILLHMATFFVVTMVCHGELARDRPSPKHLTNFYLIMSVGGMLGGLFNAFVAPIFFTFTSEYPITLVLACFMLPAMFEEKGRRTTNWTSYLDILLPLGIFFLCRMIQPNADELGAFVYANGKYIVACLALFLISAGISVFLLEKDVHGKVALGIFLGSSLAVYGMVGPLMAYLSTIQEPKFFANFASLTTPDVWRWLAVAVPVAIYAWYWNRFGKREDFLAKLATAYGSLAVAFAFMLLLGNMLATDILVDMALKAKIREETVQQILIFGVPAMICYFFVERPYRFGAAVAALWLATFYTEYKAGGDAIHDRSFFGRLKIDTDVRWKFLPAALFPKQIENDTENYEIITIKMDDDIDTTYKLRATDKPIYRTVTRRRQGENGVQVVETSHFIRRSHTTLVHGTTTHGMQENDKVRQDITRAMWMMASNNALSASLFVEAGAGLAMQYPGRDPLSYYHREGPIGSMFDVFNFRNRQKENPNTNVACIGLGTGTLSAYGLPGQQLTFFEIDTHVRNLVEPTKHFTFLDSAKKQGVNIDFVMGDARVSLERLDRKFGFILVDAFSSDSIPAHLLTKESFELYFNKMEPDGLLAVHISNRYLDLEPVVERLCREMGLRCRVMHGSSDPSTRDTHGPYWSTFKFAASWIAIAKTEEALGAIEEDAKAWEAEAKRGNSIYYDRWQPLRRKDSVGLWTDDYSPIIPILRGEFRFWSRSEE